MAWLFHDIRTWRRVCIGLLGTWFILSFLVAPFVEGKRRGSGRSLPLKIVEHTTSPSPFKVGDSELSLSIVVELPRKLNGANLLEFTALISSPSRNSMRFLSQRLPLTIEPNPQENSHVHTVLFWDGRDQAKNFVRSGLYRYEVRAKLMTEEGTSPRTKIESTRSRGTVEVINNNDPSS